VVNGTWSPELPCQLFFMEKKVNKAKADLIKAHGVYIKAQDKMFEKLAALQKECNKEMSKLFKLHGFKGIFRPSSLNFEGGILVKSWKLGTYMVIDFDSPDGDSFISVVKKSAPAFYRKFGIKIFLGTKDNEKIYLP